MIRSILPLVCLLLNPTIQAEEAGSPPKIMSYNAYMLDDHLGIFIGGTNPNKRAKLLAESTIFDNTDILVFNEIFDNEASGLLIDELTKKFPYSTPVLGRTKYGWDSTEGWRSTSLDDGGVVILSKYPIDYKAQVIFDEGCGADWLSQKGFIHAVINKNGDRYNILGTHVQADDSSCQTSPSVVRHSQFSQIDKYISGTDRSFDEMFIVAGDLNVPKSSQEFPSMIETLDVSEPTNYAGSPYSWDPQVNGLAHANYPKGEGQLLDYILVARSHKQPKNWHNQVLDVLSERVELPGTQEPYYFYEYSDHFPVLAFDYADENTQTQSFRPINKPYNTIKLKHKMSSNYVLADPNTPDGWLTYDNKSNVPNALFKLDNWHPYNGVCIHDNDYVQVSRMDSYKNFYWNYSRSSYYTKYDNASDFMKISRPIESDDCIENGDTIYFYDHANIVSARPDEYLEPKGTYIEAEANLPVGDNGLFTIEMPEFEYAHWETRLKYR